MAEVTSIRPRIALQLAVIALLGVLVAGCGGGSGSSAPTDPGAAPIHTLQEAQQPAKWTVLVYLDADNDLEDAGIHNFNQMETVGSTQDVHVIVQMDRRTGNDPLNERWTDTRRYLVVRDSDSRVMHSLRLDSPPLGELNMASANTLRDFVQWGKSQFPADHYLLVVWDHGSGWRFRTLQQAQRYKAIAADDTSGSEMNITDIPAALSGQKVDVLAFDACYMQQLEVAYELRNCADYLVASAATEPSPGYNYSRLLKHVAGTTTPVQMCQTIVQQYAAEYPNPETDITQSAIDLSKISSVAAAVNDLADVLLANQSLSSGLAAARRNSLDYSVNDGYYSQDLLDYTERCAAAIGPSATSASTALESAVNDALVCSMHNNDMPKAQGMAVYVPSALLFDHHYPQLAFSQDTSWDEWLQAQQQ